VLIALFLGSFVEVGSFKHEDWHDLTLLDGGVE
jgi:hypothetical protein